MMSLLLKSLPVLFKKSFWNRVVKLFSFNLALFIFLSSLSPSFCSDSDESTKHRRSSEDLENKDDTSFSSTGTTSSSSNSNSNSSHAGKSSTVTQNNSSNSNSSHAGKNKQKVFFLIHGLGADYRCFDFLENQLRRAFPDSKVIASKSLTSAETYSLHIEEQAEKRFKELLEISDIKDKSIIVVGHSQGGVSAFPLAFKSKEQGFDVAAIVPISTPLEGAPGAELVIELIKVNNGSVDEKVDFIKKIMLKILYGNVRNSLLPQNFENSIDKILGLCIPLMMQQQLLGGSELGLSQDLAQKKGLEDLVPQSQFLSNLKSQLRKNNIPILPIGAVLPDNHVIDETQFENLTFSGEFTDLFLIAQTLSSFIPNLSTAKVITSLVVDSINSDKRHDMVVPLYSQLGLNVLSQQNKDFQQSPIIALHIPIGVDFLDNQGNKIVDILHSHEMANRVIDFCKRLK